VTVSPKVPGVAMSCKSETAALAEKDPPGDDAVPLALALSCVLYALLSALLCC